ncbi:NLR family, CARD domain containing 5 isoform X2 [Cheilinus undulatus]|uniref:NLR family, CARD domain containing 5 isoform X2 n=1 Tax=Cheilinus undulatus TaxID=241271 RepID=UPI001BD5FEDC|nr:NLR family, CARD domain containing 5 isoform X2 [Cheilinus undulatus]
MDEEVDPDGDNVNSVLDQESSELFRILSSQSPEVIMQLCWMMPRGAGWNTNHVASSASGTTEYITAMLEYFRSASAAVCRSFLQSVCLLCENIPMHLESRLMSVAGYGSLDAPQCLAAEPVSLSNQVSLKNLGPSESNEKSPSPPSEQQLIKRPRIDYWKLYIDAVMSLLLRRWEQLSELLVGEVHLENVWVSPRATNRGRDRPDQTPGSSDRGSRTPELDVDYVSVEAKVTLETFLQGCAGKVTVLLGQAGSGKTVLMSCLGQLWAHGLGPIPSSTLFVLLEFRRLSLLSCPLSLCELLFQHYLPPRDDDEKAIVDYLFSNPEQSCWVLDGYDEFHGKLTKQEVQGELWDPKKRLPVADLISGLLNRQLLPGCTVVVTCRVRDVMDLEGLSDKVGQLLGWDCLQIKEYVHNFFGIQGLSENRSLTVQASDLLLSNRHLLAMSSLPALCNICCICVQHLLLKDREPEEMQMIVGSESEAIAAKGVKATEEKTGADSGSGGSEAGRKDHGGRRGGSVDKMMDVTNGRAQLPLTQVQIPSTLTQVYLTALCAYLSRDPEKKEERNHTDSNTRLLQSVAFTLSHYQSEVCELSRVAWKGLEDSKILFMEEDIPQHLMELSIRTGLLSKIAARHEDGIPMNSYFFMHLTLQEFLGAVRIMTSQDVSDTQLKKRFSLKTRWTTKSDQRTVFTDSVHLFLCGLASPRCTDALVQLTSTSGGGLKWVQSRQALVLKLLQNLCHSNTLTGPKVLELCHCIQESQDEQLAKQVVGTRPTLELRNIRLLPNDIDALAFVVNSVGDTGVGLDFGACSMELECLDALPSCQYIHQLCFRGRKYGDKLAEKLSTILSKFPSLRKLEFCGSSMTATGAAILASALQDCPNITDINLSDNNLKDSGIEHIIDVFASLPRLVSILLGRNNSSLKAVYYLIRKMSSCLNILHIHADGMKDVMITFSQNSGLSSHHTDFLPTISLLNQKWSKREIRDFGKSLVCSPGVSVLDLSGGQWKVESLMILTQFLPKVNITKKIILNESCSSVEGLVVLTALLSSCPAVMELHVRLQSPVLVSFVFSEGSDHAMDEISKSLCLSYCGLNSAHLDRVWQSLGASSDLTVIDLSNNSLGNNGLKKLLDFLPRLRSIQEINASNNGITMGGVTMLAGALCSNHNLTQIHIRERGKNLLILRFCPGGSADRNQPKVFSLTNSRCLPSDVNTVCRWLVQCPSPLELDFSHSSLTDEAIENLLRFLPEMQTLQRLNVSYSIQSTSGAVMLLSCLTLSQRVKSVDLRPQLESFILFYNVKAEQASCRFTGFSLNSENYERLLEIFQQGPQLSDLDLSGNQLGDEEVKYFLDTLPRLKIIRYVNLSSHSLTQQSLVDLVNTLCVCDNVSGVEFSLEDKQRCLIWFTQDEGSEKTLSVRGSCLERDLLLRLATVVSVCPRLTKLELRNNSLDSDWIADLVKLVSSSQRGLSLSIEESWIRAEEAVGLLCSCLEMCNNIHSSRVYQRTLQLLLKKASQLTSVSLVDCAVQGYQLEPLRSIIQRFPSLTELDLSHNYLGCEGAEFLSAILPSVPNLTSLSICSKETCVDVAEKISQTLLQTPAIQCLNLSSHVFSDAAAHSITRILPHLRSLNLSHCQWTEAGGLQLIIALRQCVSLESLCLDSLQLNEKSRVCLVQSLRTVNSIRVLKLNKVTNTDDGLDLLTAMEELTHMEEIELEGWRMADRGVEQLTRLFPLWRKLRKISLSENLISDQSGDKLLEVLNVCQHLEELHLSRNHLGDLTAARMALVFPSLTHITVLDISENQIGYEGSVSLSRAIMCLKNLTRLHLTSVGTPELCAVAASLAHCPNIQVAGFGWNNCGDDVAEELARVIPPCQKLTIIDLESNSVSVTGAEALVRTLESCPALQLIRLWRNKISASEALRLSLRDKRLNFSST